MKLTKPLFLPLLCKGKYFISTWQIENQVICEMGDGHTIFITLASQTKRLAAGLLLSVYQYFIYPFKHLFGGKWISLTKKAKTSQFNTSRLPELGFAVKT